MGFKGFFGLVSNKHRTQNYDPKTFIHPLMSERHIDLIDVINSTITIIN